MSPSSIGRVWRPPYTEKLAQPTKLFIVSSTRLLSPIQPRPPIPEAVIFDGLDEDYVALGDGPTRCVSLWVRVFDTSGDWTFAAVVPPGLVTASRNAPAR